MLKLLLVIGPALLLAGVPNVRTWHVGVVSGVPNVWTWHVGVVSGVPNVRTWHVGVVSGVPDVRTWHVGVVSGLPAASRAAARLAAGPVERFTATAVTHSPGGRAMGVNVAIVVDRWSTAAERDRVIATLKSKGPGALLDLLRGLPGIGSISTPTSPGTSLRFADARPAADGGRRIILATERPMSPDSGRKRLRRAADADYPFSVVDIRVDSKGSGEGTLAYAAKLVLDTKTGTVEVDNYAAELVQLTSVRPGGTP